MREYERTSRIRSFSQLQPSLQQAIQQHTLTHELNETAADSLLCIETISQRLPGSFWARLKSKFSGLPAPGAIQHSAALITPHYLMWAVTNWDDGETAVAHSVRLQEAEITEYAYAHMVEDDGLNILGMFSGALERASAFFGLDSGNDATKFKAALHTQIHSNKTIGGTND